MASIERENASNPSASLGGRSRGTFIGTDLAHTSNLRRGRLLSFNGDVLLPDEDRTGARPAAFTPISGISPQKAHQWRRKQVDPTGTGNRFHRLLHCSDEN